ncbi:hypothetical protein BDQ17DRAFT_1360293 [Cyathus striatus]|nr:hypothetical protein BDQ17DRAFT_1360293 [Cyathus striatus]
MVSLHVRRRVWKQLLRVLNVLCTSFFKLQESFSSFLFPSSFYSLGPDACASTYVALVQFRFLFQVVQGLYHFLQRQRKPRFHQD